MAEIEIFPGDLQPPVTGCSKFSVQCKPVLNPASFCLFSSFYQYDDKYCIKFDYINEKSIVVVFGIRTPDLRMVGADEST